MKFYELQRPKLIIIIALLFQNLNNSSKLTKTKVHNREKAQLRVVLIAKHPTNAVTFNRAV